MRIPFVSTVRCVISLMGSSHSPGHHGQHALNQLGILIDAARLQEMLHLRREPMNGGVGSGELGERPPELERLLEVGRTLTASVRMDEVWNRRRGPGRLDDL